MLRLFIFLLSGTLIAGCNTTPPLDSDRFDSSISVRQAAKSFGEYRDQELLWGGRLISIGNLTEGTQLEIVSYPLRSDQTPNTEKSSAGRFIVLTKEFLEPLDFHEGRLVTAGGRLDRIEFGTVGAVEYRYPVLIAEEVQLWSPSELNRRPRVHFGFGVIFGN